MIYSRVGALARYLPDNPVDNHELVRRYDYPEPADKISERIEIHCRYFAAPGETTISMAGQVARDLIERCPQLEERLDLLIFVSYTMDVACPGSAITVAHECGLRPSLTFDLSAACAGFAAAVDVADQYLRSGCERVLIIASEVQSRHLVFDSPHHRIASVFGDGAAGAVLERASEPGIIATARRTHPESARALLRYHHGGSPEQPDYPQGKFELRSPQDVAVGWTSVSAELGAAALDAASMTIRDVRWIVSHQARPFLARSVGEALGDADKMFVNADRVGNLASASVPFCLSELVELGQLDRGDLVLVIGAGAGFTGVAFVVRF